MSRLISGTPYSLNEIFSGDNEKVIIPDLQRDYCWGNPYSKEGEESLVDSFLDSVIKLDWDKDITMGLVYGYYDKLKPYQLQLCDGQQRLTTLFLIIGVINRHSDNKYREVLISNFELNEDDNEPHLLYGIRESSLYFLSDLTINYFMSPKLTFSEIENQCWFLNSYKQDPTILSILRAIKSIEKRLENFDNLNILGDFLQRHLKFLFYDMNDRQNGEETFVVINTTGEPLSANQNLKPIVILNNTDYSRIVQNEEGETKIHNTAQDWEEMETWFWQKRHLNEIDTSTEGMLAFLHCVRVLECNTEEDWHRSIDINNDKFPLSIKMRKIWEWFCAYKRIYELDYKRMSIPNIEYPERQSHYTQKDLYSLLPTMLYCRQNKNATDIDIQRVYHLFYNMGRYRNVTRSSQNETLNVPAFRTCQLVKSMPNNDVLSLLDVKDFNVDEEKNKLLFIRQYEFDEQKRNHIEEKFAKAESFNIFEGRISTLVKWSNLSIEKLEYYFSKIDELWMKPDSRNKLRRALLAYGIGDYPMSTGTANMTLCSKTDWRVLFEKQGEKMASFIENGSIEEIINSHSDSDSPYYLLIHRESLLDFSEDHKIRVYPQGVVELMAKTRASANFILIHRGEIFEKNMVDMNYWNGFWVWSDGEFSVFYSSSYNYNITLDMNIIPEGYEIVPQLDRRPGLHSVKQDVLKELGFYDEGGVWKYPIIESPNVAKRKFQEITQRIR